MQDLTSDLDGGISHKGWSKVSRRIIVDAHSTYNMQDFMNNTLFCHSPRCCQSYIWLETTFSNLCPYKMMKNLKNGNLGPLSAIEQPSDFNLDQQKFRNALLNLTSLNRIVLYFSSCNQITDHLGTRIL